MTYDVPERAGNVLAGLKRLSRHDSRMRVVMMELHRAYQAGRDYERERHRPITADDIKELRGAIEELREEVRQ